MECGFADDVDWSGWKAEVPQAAGGMLKIKRKHTGGLD